MVANRSCRLRGRVLYQGRTTVPGADNSTSGHANQPELLERGDAVVEPDLLDDLPVLHLQHRRAGELHPFARVGAQRAHQEIAEGRPGVRAAAFPPAHDVVTLRDQISRAPEVEVRERPAE